MNTKTAAEKVGVSESTIRRWCRTGRIEATKSGRAWVIEPASLPTQKETKVEYKSGDQIEIAGETVTLVTKRRNQDPSKVWWIAVVENLPAGVQDYKRCATAEEAIAAARQYLGVDADTARTCMRCSKPATMNASLGPACDDHYDTLSA